MKTSLTALFIFLLVFAADISAQRLVKSANNGQITAEQAAKRIAELFPRTPFLPRPANITLKKITYTSVDAKGKSVNLTGLVAMPAGGAPNGLVVFCHGTTQDRNMSPSRYKGAGDGSETEMAVLAFASGGYALVLPDYLGLGDHKGAHPYPLSVTNARSARDAILPSRALAAQSRYKIGEKLFVTGYSEGGGVAMALTKDLQSLGTPEYRVERSAPASGPYDLSGVTREFMLKEPTDQLGFGVRLYLMSYSTYYFRKERNIKITNYFKPAMANSIWLNYNAGLKDETLITRIGLAAVLMRANNSLRNVMTDEAIRKFERLDKSDPLIAELANNDVYDWTPRAPMLLINLEGDGVVSPENTEKAFQTMRGRGVGRDALRRYVIRDKELNHITAVPAAMAAARAFFDGGFSGVRGVE